jgi:membrane-associated protease RseP (regulator of RpoE activity)
MTTEAAEPIAWKRHLWLFLATVASAFVTRYFATHRPLDSVMFAATILTILVAHELGHYIAARLHKVDASLPFFIPLPIISPFGTMGAIIQMRGTIPTRRALLDIGAAGPLAGLAFAIPLYAWGIAHSTVITLTGNEAMLGNSLLLHFLDGTFGPAVGPGQDILLSPVAFGAWGGMLVTMINLIPVGQLDGGHVAYALFGVRQNKFAVLVHRALLAFFFVVVGGHLARDVSGGFHAWMLGKHLATALPWLVWYQLLAILGTLGARARDDYEEKAGTVSIRMRLLVTGGLLGIAIAAQEVDSVLVPLAFFGTLAIFLAMEAKGGMLKKNDLLDHPSTSAAPLDIVRIAVAVITLLFFVLLFMPEPMPM